MKKKSMQISELNPREVLILLPLSLLLVGFYSGVIRI
jgi:hypothetical protein